MDLDLSDFAHFWGECKHSYVLVQHDNRQENSLKGCVLVDLYQRTMISIEDNAIAVAVMERMKQEGVRVVDRGMEPKVDSPISQIYRDAREGRITWTEVYPLLRSLTSEANRRDWVRQNENALKG